MRKRKQQSRASKLERLIPDSSSLYRFCIGLTQGNLIFVTMDPNILEKKQELKRRYGVIVTSDYYRAIELQKAIVI